MEHECLFQSVQLSIQSLFGYFSVDQMTYLGFKCVQLCQCARGLISDRDLAEFWKYCLINSGMGSTDCWIKGVDCMNCCAVIQENKLNQCRTHSSRDTKSYRQQNSTTVRHVGHQTILLDSMLAIHLAFTQSSSNMICWRPFTCSIINLEPPWMVLKLLSPA